MLRVKAGHFEKAGRSYLKQYSNKVLKKDKNLRLVVSYLYEQSLELYLKYLCELFIGHYPHSHKIYKLSKGLILYLDKREIDGKTILIKQLNYLDENTRVFEKIAFGSKYEDIPITMEELNNLITQVECLRRWIERYGGENDRNINQFTNREASRNH